ncbi:hypothetical protein PR048_007117 [Dryococelus australis]|uniref:Uncharacterized protein n=1 Tax=Dryococelus australis TaxID=614101 RepID=A0ABQ9ICT0_9NEOP|nr:hypothetical protein PR048_007117 [Dryococelus australis]
MSEVYGGARRGRGAGLDAGSVRSHSVDAWTSCVIYKQPGGSGPWGNDTATGARPPTKDPPARPSRTPSPPLSTPPPHCRAHTCGHRPPHVCTGTYKPSPRGTQLRRRAVIVRTCAHVLTRRPLQAAAIKRGSARGDRDMRINSPVASTRKALNWRAVLPSITPIHTEANTCEPNVNEHWERLFASAHHLLGSSYVRFARACSLLLAPVQVGLDSAHAARLVLGHTLLRPCPKRQCLLYREQHLELASPRGQAVSFEEEQRARGERGRLSFWQEEGGGGENAEPSLPSQAGKETKQIRGSRSPGATQLATKQIRLLSSSELERCNSFLCRSSIRSRIEFRTTMVQPGTSDDKRRSKSGRARISAAHTRLNDQNHALFELFFHIALRKAIVVIAETVPAAERAYVLTRRSPGAFCGANLRAAALCTSGPARQCCQPLRAGTRTCATQETLIASVCARAPRAAYVAGGPGAKYAPLTGQKSSLACVARQSSPAPRRAAVSRDLRPSPETHLRIDELLTASHNKSSDIHKSPYDLVKLCRERKINIKAPERVNVDPLACTNQRRENSASLQHNTCALIPSRYCSKR